MMPDYAKLLDAEVLGFIERTNAHYPRDMAGLTIDQRRHVYDRLCRAFFNGYPEGVRSADSWVTTQTHQIPIRTYQTAARDQSAKVLYFHGGGFALGGLDSHDDICAELCFHSGYEVTSVDYRLAPEHPHPAAFEDAFAAFHWAAAADKRPIVLAGDSAGGNLAAAVAHLARGHERAPVGQVLIYPTLGGDVTSGSYVTHADAPLLTTRDVAFADEVRTRGADFSSDVRFRPLADTDFSGLPATVLIAAECDPLCSDGAAYRDRVLGAGGRAFLHEEPGLVHGYLRARHSVAKARESFARIVQAVKALAGNEWPY